MTGKANQEVGPILVQVLSDLHEERGSLSTLQPSAVGGAADIVVIAGDIARAPDAVASACRLFPFSEVVVLVAGNHEHYATNLTVDEGIAAMRRAAEDFSSVDGRQICVLEDDERLVKVRGISLRVIGSTLWTDYNLFGDREVDSRRCAQALNDHRLIRGQGRRLDGSSAEDRFFTVGEAYQRHQKSRAFLEAALAREHDGPTIVVTHHLPSMRSVSARYRADRVSAAFASRLDKLVAQNAALWVHGHTHDSCSWRDEGGTLVVCNPAGYVLRTGARENSAFNPKLLVEIAGIRGGLWRAELAADSLSLSEA